MKLKTTELEFHDGVAVCVMEYGNKRFIGDASCHDEDLDFCSELVGLSLAERRAFLAYLKDQRDEFAIRVKRLKGAYDSLSNSKEFNHKSAMAKAFRGMIAADQSELDMLREEVAAIKESITVDIANRDKMYKSLRDSRQNGYKPKFVIDPEVAEELKKSE